MFELDDIRIPLIQILDEEGKADPGSMPDLSDDMLLNFYRTMKLSRLADERMLKMQRQGRIGTFAPCTGQEAISIGAAHAMGDDDWLVGAFRELGARLVRGGTLTNELLLYNGYEEGNISPTEANGKMLPIAVVIGTQLLQATGIAYSMQYREEKGAVVTFMGDGATSQGDFHEALNFASVWKSPVVFIIQNNQWAISTPLNKQTRSRTLAQKGIAYDIPSVQVDGNDVMAMYEATRQALDRAHRGEGPSLIEAVTYRLLMHTTADDPKKYRSEEEENLWWKKEPLLRMRAYLESRKLWDEKKEEALVAEVTKDIEKSVQEFESLTDFREDIAFDHVYEESHPEIERQRQRFLKDLKEEKIDG